MPSITGALLIDGRFTVVFPAYAGSDKGGRTVDTLCSFVASCQRHALDPFAYLRDVLARISVCPINDLDQFLPDRWQLAATRR